MTRSSPLVSVLVPAFNHGEFLKEMAASVLRQTMDDLELLVVEDGSTDDSAQILHAITSRDARVRVLRHPGGANRGPGASMALAAGAAVGRFLACIDADDRWHRDKLARQIETLGEGSTLSYARARCVDESGTALAASLGRAPHELGVSPLEAILRGNFVPKLTAFFPARAYRRAGGIDPSQRYEDYDLWMRLLCLGSLSFVDQELATYRFSPGGRDLRHLRAGWDFRGALQAIDHLYLWPGLPHEHVESVDGWRRCYRVVADLVDGFGTRNLGLLRPPDAARLTALIREREGRLPALVGGDELLSWMAAVRKLGSGFRTEVVPELDRQLALAPGADDVRFRKRRTSWRGRRRMAEVGHGVEGNIDEPTNDQVVLSPTLEVRGWAMDDGAIPEAVLIRVNGVIQAAARIRLPRPDVAAAFPGSPESGHSGWSAEVDLTETPDGAPVVAADVVRQRGGIHRIGEVTVRPVDRDTLARPVGMITDPKPGEPVGQDWVWVRGWAVCRASPISRVDVRLDDRVVGPAGLARPSPEVARAVSLPGAIIAGFEMLVELPPTPGEVLIGAVAHSLDGAVEELPTVRIARGAVTSEGNEGTSDWREPRRAQTGQGVGIRLLFFTHALEATGAPRCLVDLVRALAVKPGVACSVVSFADGLLRSELESEGVAVHVTSPASGHDPAAFDGRVLELGSWIASGNHDVAIVNSLAAFAGVHSAARARLPSMWIVHEGYSPGQFLAAFFVQPTPHPGVGRRLVEAFRLADVTVFQAEETQRTYAGTVAPRVAVTLPYGIDLRAVDAARRGADRTALRRARGVPDDATLLLYPGRLEARRSQALLLLAVKELIPEHPDLFVVLLGDTGGHYSKAIVDYLAETDLSRRVHIVPEDLQVFDWYACADVVISLPDIGSLPRTVVEALAMGVPVVTSDVGGVTHLLTDADAGAVCAPNDLSSTIEALDQTLRRQRGLSEATAAGVRSRHDSERYADQCMRMARELAGGRTLSSDGFRQIVGE